MTHLAGGDPQGPEEGESRVLRGGGWVFDAPWRRAACVDARDRLGVVLQ